MRVHFTDISVKKFKPGSYWDDSTPGFGVRVGKHAKTWTIMRGASRERITIGRYPDLSLSEARTEAKRLLIAAPEPKFEAILFENARDEFVEENYRHRSQRSKKEAGRVLKKHFRSMVGRALPSLEDADIKRCLDKLKATPSEQLHAYRILRRFFRWCTFAPRRYLKHSPMEGYEAPSKDRKGTRILSDQEIRAVWEAAEGPRLAIVRLLILWGTRNTETASLERSWAQDGVMTIPGSHTKNGRDHSIPMLPLALEILSGLPAGKHYFPSRWGESHLQDGSWSKIKREIQARSGTKNWQIRDLRRTFRSAMARLKVSREVAEVLINHAPPVLDEIYDRYDRLDEKRDALQRYEGWLRSLISG
jgi:hypothetical protein